VTYRGLRDWIEQVDKMGELLRLNGVHWDKEMGATTQVLTEKSKGTAPAVLFDEVPNYPKGFRTLYGQFSSIKRVALTLGLPLEYERKVDIVKAYHKRMQNMSLIKPKFVKSGPILDHVLEGDEVDVLKFPVPLHHELDKARYIGTADLVITKDPDADWYNLGAYRCQVYDGKTIGCQITEGKHGRIHRDKYFERGQNVKVAVVCGQDPLLYMLSASPLPSGISEYDFAGGLRGEPIEVAKGPYTGFPIPADAEIVIEGEMVPGQVKPEGPFGEWMGYYSDDVVPRPYIDVKTILYRDNPILTCAPQHKPVDETGLLKGIAGAAEIWKALEACGLPDILGVWNHEGGPATRFTAIQIRQRYPGHARNVLHVASSCAAGAYNGKWTVVVDEDVDCSDLDQVLWAMCTRFDPVTDIDIIQKAWSSGRDPMFLPGNFNNRILIDACIPYDRKLKDKFPTVVDVSPELRAKLKAKLGKILASV
ncbi:MAG TPA: UbiD family decarboxylase, partial [Candidatus Binatia bacterium]|nr:UbiD family decarboxylase [Candidatus Binatia bacterium]